MNWFHKLFGVEAPENATLNVAELSLRGPVAGWIASLLLVAVVAGVYFLYAHERARLRVGRRILLVLLRAAVIGMVLLFLRRPVLVAAFNGQRPQAVVLLVDNSQSMTQQDRRLSVRDRFRVWIAEGTVAPDAVPPERTADMPAGSKADPSRADLV